MFPGRRKAFRCEWVTNFCIITQRINTANTKPGHRTYSWTSSASLSCLLKHTYIRSVTGYKKLEVGWCNNLVQVWWFCVPMSNLDDHLLRPSRHGSTHIRCSIIGQLDCKWLVDMPYSEVLVDNSVFHELRQVQHNRLDWLHVKFCISVWAASWSYWFEPCVVISVAHL